MEAIAAELVDMGAKRDGRGRRLAVRREREAVIAAYEQSGMTQREFAQREGIKFHTFTGWLKRYRQPGEKLAFAQVRVAKPTPRSKLTVKLPSGLVVRGTDAEQLARLHRAGELRAINVPDEVDESVRDLTRARADAVHDLTRAKQRLKSFLLRQGYKYPGSANWSEAHQRYLRKLTLPLPALRSVLEEQLLAIDQATERLKRLDELMEVQIPQWRHYPAVRALMCLRGFQMINAAVMVAESGDMRRFAHPKNFMGFLGLVPKEETTGDSRKLGSITKAGNAHARWCLIEAIQSAYGPPKLSSRLSLRQEGQPKAYRDLAWKIQVRLHKRGWHLLHRGVMKAKVNVALARELAGFVWDLLRQVPAPEA